MSNEKLKQTKGTATLRGKIYGLENENAVEVKDKFRKLKFRVNTDSDNAHFVELIDFTNKNKVSFRIISPIDKEVYSYVMVDYSFHDASIDELKEVFADDMDIEEKLSEVGIVIDDLEEANVMLAGTIAVKSEMDESTNYLLAEFAIDEILNSFKDGDSVVVVAEKTVSGIDRAYNQYAIKKIFASKELIDFNADDFIEQAEFVDEFIFNSVMKKSKEKRAEIEGYGVAYTGMTMPVNYVVDWNEYAEDEDVANHFVKNVKFGELVKVEGVVHNRVTYGEVASSEGVGRSTRANAPRREITGEKRELQIIKFDKVVGKYTEKQLISE